MEATNANIFTEIILPILATISILFIVFKIYTLPISIAKNKNLESRDITTIRILTWCGLFAGITWFIALFMALSYRNYEL